MAAYFPMNTATDYTPPPTVVAGAGELTEARRPPLILAAKFNTYVCRVILQVFPLADAAWDRRSRRAWAARFQGKRRSVAIAVDDRIDLAQHSRIEGSRG
jgi:hypothetical protein